MPTIEGMISRWRSAVDEVESGYEGNIDDYINDLSNRERIREIADALTEYHRHAVSALVDPIDARFRRATREDSTKVVRKFTTYGTGWWWARLPCQLGGALLSTIRRHM
jgi:hypothetical protein